MEPPNEGRPPPGANGRGLRKNVGLGSSDDSKNNPPSYPAQPRNRSPVLGGRFLLDIPPGPGEQAAAQARLACFTETPSSDLPDLRRTRFARSMVFEEFKYKHARAIDYDGFIDRKPNQRPRLPGAAS